MRPLLMSILVGIAMLSGAITVNASGWSGWFTGSDGAQTETSETLESVARWIAALPPSEVEVPLALDATPVGHWRLVNRLGEPFTASGPDELARGFATLAPDAQAKPERLVLYVTADTVFQRREAISALPPGARLAVVIAGRALTLARIGRGDGQKLAIEVERGVYLEAGRRAQFDEARWQLSRPLVRSSVRTLAFAPGGPTQISRAPNVDGASRRARPDEVDPRHLDGALNGLAGQTVLASGRLDGERLRYQPATGPEATLDIGTLTAAARRADVGLIVLESTSARQPGTRNWLYQRIALAQFDKALLKANLGGFLHVLAGEPDQLLVRMTAHDGDRVALALTPHASRAADAVGTLTQAVTGQLSGLLPETAGSVAVIALLASLPSSDRQRELAWRLLPHVPAWLQLGYAGLLVIGVALSGTIGGWWRRLWPPEVASDYGRPLGYRLAAAVRLLMLVVIFLPFAALPAVGTVAFCRLWLWFLSHRAPTPTPMETSGP